FRRRHQPRRPPPAKIRPGRPAPAMGPGTGAGVSVTGPTMALRVPLLRNEAPLAQVVAGDGPKVRHNPPIKPIVEDLYPHIAHVHRPFAPTMSRWRDHGLYDRPFGIGQITGVTKATAVRRKAVFGCPHRALLKRESSARQGITSDSSDSRTSRIGSKAYNQNAEAMDAFKKLRRACGGNPGG